MKEKIAIIVDSGSDVSEKQAKDYPIYSLPLRIIIDENEYDSDEISREEVFKALETQDVSTSLPLGETILKTLKQITDEGYTHIIGISISSSLSGTFNVLRNLSEEFAEAETFVLDTKNISLGSGLLALYAAELIEEGKSFDEIVTTLNGSLEKSKVYFTAGTLDYLIRGGRIGQVAGTIANILSIKPIISCNSDGVYYTHDKVRGYRKVIKEIINTAKEFIGDSDNYKIVLLNSDSEEIDRFKEFAHELFPNNDIEVIEITPALAIHLGPEALGIAVFKY